MYNAMLYNVICTLCPRLPGPLTPAKRSRDARLGGVSQGGMGVVSPPQKLKTEAGLDTRPSSSAGPMPGDDLPPVLAPPGRSVLVLCSCC